MPTVIEKDDEVVITVSKFEAAALYGLLGPVHEGSSDITYPLYCVLDDFYGKNQSEPRIIGDRKTLLEVKATELINTFLKEIENEKPN